MIVPSRVECRRLVQIYPRTRNTEIIQPKELIRQKKSQKKFFWCSEIENHLLEKARLGSSVADCTDLRKRREATASAISTASKHLTPRSPSGAECTAELCRRSRRRLREAPRSANSTLKHWGPGSTSGVDGTAELGSRSRRQLREASRSAHSPALKAWCSNSPSGAECAAELHSSSKRQLREAPRSAKSATLKSWGPGSPSGLDCAVDLRSKMRQTTRNAKSATAPRNCSRLDCVAEVPSNKRSPRESARNINSASSKNKFRCSHGTSEFRDTSDSGGLCFYSSLRCARGRDVSGCDVIGCDVISKGRPQSASYACAGGEFRPTKKHRLKNGGDLTRDSNSGKNRVKSEYTRFPTRDQFESSSGNLQASASQARPQRRSPRRRHSPMANPFLGESLSGRLKYGRFHNTASHRTVPDKIFDGSGVETRKFGTGEKDGFKHFPSAPRKTIFPQVPTLVYRGSRRGLRRLTLSDVMHVDIRPYVRTSARSSRVHSAIQPKDSRSRSRRPSRMHHAMPLCDSSHSHSRHHPRSRRISRSRSRTVFSSFRVRDLYRKNISSLQSTIDKNIRPSRLTNFEWPERLVRTQNCI